MSVANDPAAAIRAVRAASNQAIAARDADRVVLYMLPTVTVSVAHGPVLAGRDASRAAFAEQFRDRHFAGYVREARDVVVHPPGTSATERGVWVGRWRRGTHEDIMRGTYRAEWTHTDMGWQIQSEVFIAGDV